MLSSITRSTRVVDNIVKRLSKNQCALLVVGAHLLKKNMSLTTTSQRNFCSSHGVEGHVHNHNHTHVHEHVQKDSIDTTTATTTTTTQKKEKTKKEKSEKDTKADGNKPEKTSKKKQTKAFKTTLGVIPTPQSVLVSEARAQMNHDLFSNKDDYFRRKIGRLEDGSFADVVKTPRMSAVFNPTQFDIPSDAVTISHQLLLKAGFIKQLSSGHYIFMPLAHRVFQKISDIIDDEMRNVGGQRVDLPLIMSKNLWDMTGRWESSGTEMFRIKDRSGAEFCLGPTHEEAITWLTANMVSSHNQLPLMFYQIGKKFRDEARPRGGLLRTREFVMKDLYSFDKDYEQAHATYKLMVAAYQTVFARLNVPVVQVEADSGNIGGNLSHEYHVLSPTGEDTLLRCELCGYTANEEKTQFTIQPEFDLSEHESKLKTGPATEAMKDDPRSIGLWPTAEEVASRAHESQEEHDKRTKIDIGVRSTIASIVKKLLPEAARNDVPMVCNLFQLKDFKKGDQVLYDSNGNVTYNPNSPADPTSMGRNEGDFKNLALIMFRADREPNLRAIASYYDVSDAELIPAPRAALILLRFHKFKTRQHQLRKDAGQLPTTHDNPFERLTTRFKQLSLEELAQLESEGPEVYIERMKEVDREVARMNIDGGMSIMIDTSLVAEQHDLDSGLHGDHPDLDFGSNAELGRKMEQRRKEAEAQGKSLEGVFSDDEGEDIFASSRGTEADRVYTPLNPVQGDFVLPKEGDRCIQQQCNSTGVLRQKKGIEVGHVFYLGQKYSKPMAAKFTDDKGKAQTIEMGCYGIGVTRIMAAAVESEIGHDEFGIRWPEPIAPYTVYITAIGKPGEVELAKKVEEVTKRLTSTFAEGPATSANSTTTTTNKNTRFPSRNEDGDPFNQEDAYYDSVGQMAGQESALHRSDSQMKLGLGLRNLMSKKNRVVRFSPVQTIMPRIADSEEMKSVEIQSLAWNWGHTDNPTHAENIAASLQVHAPYLTGDVIIDDRHDLSPGQRLKDATLMGFPYIIIVGRDMQAHGMVEVQHRATGISQLLSIDNLMRFFMGAIPKEERYEYDEKTTRLAYKYDTERRVMEQFGLDTTNYAPPDELMINLDEEGIQYDYNRPTYGDRMLGVENADIDQVLDDFSEDDEDDLRAKELGFGSTEARDVNSVGMMEVPESEDGQDVNSENDDILNFAPHERKAESPLAAAVDALENNKLPLHRDGKKKSQNDFDTESLLKRSKVGVSPFSIKIEDTMANATASANTSPSTFAGIREAEVVGVPPPSGVTRSIARVNYLIKHLPGNLNPRYLSHDETEGDDYIRFFKPFRTPSRPAYSMKEIDAMYNTGLLYTSAGNAIKINLDLILENVDLIGGREFSDTQQVWIVQNGPASILNVTVSALEEASAMLLVKGPLSAKEFHVDYYKARNKSTRQAELNRHGLISPDGTVHLNRLQAIAKNLGVIIPDELLARIRVEETKKELEKYQQQLDSIKNPHGNVKAKTAAKSPKSQAPKSKSTSNPLQSYQEEDLTYGSSDKTVLRTLGLPTGVKKNLYYDEDLEPKFINRSIRSAPLTIDPTTGEKRSFRLKKGSIIPNSLKK